MTVTIPGAREDAKVYVVRLRYRGRLVWAIAKKREGVWVIVEILNLPAYYQI